MNSTNHPLHVHFSQRNQQAFTKLLDSYKHPISQNSIPALSSSASKSWSRSSSNLQSLSTAIDVNARDEFGRTILHLACTDLHPSSLEYVKLLLALPNINVNLQDKENQWTALHRALYVGNISASLLLLKRNDVDVRSKDYEGYTPFDVYNSTVRGTAPDPILDSGARRALYTWGTNRNATLGNNDSSDRSSPDQILLNSASIPLQGRGGSSIEHIAMARFHTAILTDEASTNAWLCGFGSGGRLGLTSHTQYEFTPLPSLNRHVDRIALGQDHTIALCEGEVYTWGMNRFAQLGYILDNAKTDDMVQLSPRKVHGALRKEHVIGIAATKTASVCWTTEILFSWGTNNAQLGYDSAAQPIQISPRRVTRGLNSDPVDVAISDHAMVCLTRSKELICFYNDLTFKVHLPTITDGLQFPLQNAFATKVVTSDNVFAVLTSRGDVFTFPLGSSLDLKGKQKDSMLVKPQIVWALRKKFSAVKDLALGMDGSLILCTASGHVFVRTRVTKLGNGKGFKFEAVPYVHRAIEVCANNAGSYAAICLVHSPEMLPERTPSFAEDISKFLPLTEVNDQLLLETCHTAVEHDEMEGSESDILNHVGLISKCLTAHMQRIKCENTQLRSCEKNWPSNPSATDIRIHCGREVLRAHRNVLLIRCRKLRELAVNGGVLCHDGRSIRFTTTSSELHDLSFVGFSPFTVFCFLCFVYTDEILAIWDHRVDRQFRSRLLTANVSSNRIRFEMQQLAQLLELDSLQDSLQLSVSRRPLLTLEADFAVFYKSAQAELSELCNVRVHFGGFVLPTHSLVLCARSKYFADFFDDADWVHGRRDLKGLVDIFLPHIPWSVAAKVFPHLCYGCNFSAMDVPAFPSSEAAVDFYFDIMAICNELLLDELMTLCCNAILRLVDLSNLVAILTEAAHLQFPPLRESLHRFVGLNLEEILEHHLFDDLDPKLVRDLTSDIAPLQRSSTAATRCKQEMAELIEKHNHWLSLQDIPTRILASDPTAWRQASPKQSPRPRPSTLRTPVPSPSTSKHPSHRSHSDLRVEDVFLMDEEISKRHNACVADEPSTVKTFTWAKEKTKETFVRPKFNDIIAEAQTAKTNLAAEATLSSTFNHPLARMSMLKPLGITPPLPEQPNSLSLAVSGGGITSPRLNSSRSVQRTTERQGRSVSHLTSATSAAPLSGPRKQSAPTSQASPQGKRLPGQPVWNQATAASQPIEVPPEAGELSFAAIQKEQQGQSKPVARPQPNLREIQAQEAERQQEAQFLQWWATEEERIRREETGNGAESKRVDNGQKNRNRMKSNRTARTTKPRSREVATPQKNDMAVI